MKKSNTNLILIFSIILFILVTSFFVYFLKIIKDKNNHISNVVMILEKKIIDKENINILKEKMEELLEINKKIDSYILDTSKVYIFVEYLENIGVDNNVDLVVNSVEVSKNEKNRILTSLNIIGSFSDVIKVIGIIENSSYNITMNSSYINKEIISPSNKEESLSISTNNEASILEKYSWQVNLKFSVLSL